VVEPAGWQTAQKQHQHQVSTRHKQTITRAAHALVQIMSTQGFVNCSYQSAVTSVCIHLLRPMSGPILGVKTPDM
jgi:hypothetical protein